MPVHPEIRKFLDILEAANLAPLSTLTPEQARAQMEATAAARPGEPTAVNAIEHLQVPGPHGDIPVRIYRANDSTQDQPLLVYFHGGGHVIGSLDTHDATARNLCAGAQCVVASVDYRMGPEHPFPAAVDDSIAATAWLSANASSLGVDATKIAVGGDSAGGNLAAVVALDARDNAGPALCFQLLVYPLADYRCNAASYEQYASGYGMLEATSMYWFRDHYLRNEADQEDWRASPLLAANHGGLPPALVITAECDVLHDEGVAYAQCLASSGSIVEHLEGSGMIHGFFGMAPMISGAVVAQAQAVAAMRQAFGQ
jgi:acetyl esterase